MSQSPDGHRDPDIADALARHVIDVRFEDIPSASVDIAKSFLLDTIGVAIAGWSAPGCAAVHGLVQEWGGAPQSTVWVYGSRVPAPNAALVNGLLCHAREFDDLHGQGHVHCFAPVLPATLAVAESQPKVSGRDFLTALILGVDVMARLGLAIESERGWHYTLTFGVFGAAAAAGRLLGLDRSRILNALGIAFSHAGGTEQCVVEATLVKRLHPGLAAQAGMTSALLAKRGITGPSRSFEGRLGYYPVHENGIYHRDRVLDGLGQRFEIDGLGIKPYPACGYVHASLDAVFELVRTHRLKAADVQQIDVAVSQTAFDLVGQPFEVRNNPQADAQFSIPYVIAAALRHGRVSLHEFEESAIFDDATQMLARKVRVGVDQSIEPRALAPARVRVRTSDGRTLEAISGNRGHPGNPLPPADIERKFRDCLSYSGLPAFTARADKLAETIRKFETIADVTELAALLSPEMPA